MREDVLQNDTENMKQGHKENTASGRDVTIEMVDLTGDEWNAPEPDNENAGFLFESFDRYLPMIRIALPVLAVVFVALIVIIASAPKGSTKNEKPAESFVSSTPRQEGAVDVKSEKTSRTSNVQTGTGQRQPDSEKEKTAEDEAMAEKIEKEQERYKELHDMIFGESDGNSVLGCVTTVTGFTDREKREIGFQEADFLKDAGAFLSRQQIQTKRIIIEDRIAASSEDGIAFQGRLEGKDDYILDVLFYPDLPGEYVFLLRNIKGNERQSGANTETVAADQNTAGNSMQPQDTQSNAASREVSQTVPTPQNTQENGQTQNSYNAANLSVNQIPETLLNYIDNRYEFQYSLYEWLYDHGMKEIESASVTNYSIDGDSRKAEIDLRLSDGSSMTAVYDKTTNTYSYAR